MGNSETLLIRKVGISFKWELFLINTNYLDYYTDFSLFYNNIYNYLKYLIYSKYYDIFSYYGCFPSLINGTITNSSGLSIDIYMTDINFYKLLESLRIHFNYVIFRNQEGKIYNSFNYKRKKFQYNKFFFLKKKKKKIFSFNEKISSVLKKNNLYFVQKYIKFQNTNLFSLKTIFSEKLIYFFLVNGFFYEKNIFFKFRSFFRKMGLISELNLKQILAKKTVLLNFLIEIGFKKEYSISILYWLFIKRLRKKYTVYGSLYSYRNRILKEKYLKNYHYHFFDRSRNHVMYAYKFPKFKTLNFFFFKFFKIKTTLKFNKKFLFFLGYIFHYIYICNIKYLSFKNNQLISGIGYQLIKLFSESNKYLTLEKSIKLFLNWFLFFGKKKTLKSLINFCFNLYFNYIWFTFMYKFLKKLYIKIYPIMEKFLENEIKLLINLNTEIKIFDPKNKFISIKIYPLNSRTFSGNLFYQYFYWKWDHNYKLNYILGPFIKIKKQFFHNSYLKGFYPTARGRFTSKQRAWNLRYTYGNLKYGTYNENVNYLTTNLITKYGVGGLRLWFRLKRDYINIYSKEYKISIV